MQGISSLPPHLQQRLRAELRPGESLAWAGQPDPDRIMRSGFRIVLFFVPFTAFSLFWIAAASGFQWPRWDGGWSLFPLFGLPFLLVGLGGLASPLWLRRKSHSTVYAITSERALVIEGTGSITVKSYRPSDIAAIERTDHPDGTGDLILRTEDYLDSDGDRRTRREGFHAVRDVRRVEQLIETLRTMNA